MLDESIMVNCIRMYSLCIFVRLLVLMYTFISLTYYWIALSKLCSGVVQKFKVIGNIMSCNSSAQALQACETKLCGCSRKDDASANYESKEVEGREAPSKEREWRRHCGCIKTSEKLRQLLKSFPAPPPPSPVSLVIAKPEKTHDTCIAAYCAHAHGCHFPVVPALSSPEIKGVDKVIVDADDIKKAPLSNKWWQVVSELVQLVQLSVTATALALYYLIYCYMQLVYYTLRSALYFHNADGPMKITIGVVTLTSLVVGFNLVVRVEKLFGIFY